ncbi:MAG: glycosyltransferase family 4 protein [Clostridia bacterium]|nr:glycosyltransferase family 4 protein [Clostridia bacterium]
MENKLKICLLTFGAYPVPATEGGAVENLVEIMADNYQQGKYECCMDIVSKYSEPARQQSANYPKVKFHFIQYTRTAMKLYKFIRRIVNKLFGFVPVRMDPYFSKALDIIRKNKYDVVIVENGTYFVQALKRHCSSRIVFHLHNDFGSIEAQKPAKLVKNSDMMIAVSDYVAGNVRNTSECNYPVVTVKNVIDTRRFIADAQKTDRAKSIRKKYGFSDDDVVCLFSGRLIPEKGIHLLIDALSGIADSRIKLLVVGGTSFSDSYKTDYEQKLLDMAEKLGDRVVFTGYVDYGDIPAYYHACDIAVFPSQCPEAAGLVVLEAQSAGKPVIIANAGGMPEYVCNESAIVVPRGRNFTHKLAAAISTLSDSAELRVRMGNAGAAFAAQYDKKGYFDEILKATVTTLNL